MDENVKREFVRRVLEETGKNIVADQSRAINKYLNFRTGTLIDSKNTTSFVVSAPKMMDGKAEFTHPIYERFLDMKRIMSPQGKPIKKLSAPIHNKVIWSNLGSMVNDLNYGLTEIVGDEIKKSLDTKEI